ncbi:hypothetical protein KCN56_09350 [Photobacterium galatheae]|uniref:hypothetical protein n=1 Tax=Photobacterium galatheae TaxID=1654360 RepID=UPI00202CC4FA|nr:hypothetical protein [Photobacterium galatheae]MCM0148765.1 hypothetical protein [Photobacterium galatheae]
MKYIEKPKFIHNLWSVFEEDPNVYSLRTSKGYFEVNKDDAEIFLKFRGLCTGHHTQEEIARLSEIPREKISNIIQALDEIECLRVESNSKLLTEYDIYQKVKTACEMWSEQLEDTHLFNDILNGDHSIQVLKGFLLETYHYIKQFPGCIQAGRNSTDIQPLKEKLDIYYQQEVGHEVFILSCLKKLGFTEEEVTQSIPLVSTQSILNMIQNLFEKYPCSVALVARVIEADTYSEDIATEIRNALENNLNIERDILDGLIEHMAVDYSLGHAELIHELREFILFPDIDDVHYVLNSIHDIKHAFDVQKLEIINYYTHVGNYVPRQKVDFFGV